MISAIISIFTQIARLLTTRPSLAYANAVAAQDLEKAPVGYKTTIARLKMRDAASALASLEQEVEGLRSQVSAASETMRFFAERYADYLVKREALEAAVVAAEERVTEAQTKAKTDAWKWQKRKDIVEPPGVVAARAEVAAAKEAIVTLDEKAGDEKRIIAEFRTEENRDFEMKAWIAGGGKPEFVRIRQEAERKEFLKGCIVLTRSPPSIVPEQEEEVEGASPWVALSMEEYLVYLDSLDPKPVEEKIGPVSTGRIRESPMIRKLLAVRPKVSC